MSLIIFIIVLAVLIFVHELGHFLAAKWSGIRVDEFGLGFPPRLASFKKGETVYSINAIPFGGFVKIFGEDLGAEEASSPEDKRRNFASKPKGVQAFVLAAGVLFNFVFAWLLLSVGFMAGMPASESYSDRVSDPRLVVVSVASDSPAFSAGLSAGDVIKSVSVSGVSKESPSPEELQGAISGSGGSEISLVVERDGDKKDIAVTPEKDAASGAYMIGIGMDRVGTLRLPPHTALLEGLRMSWRILADTAGAVGNIIAGAFRGESRLADVTGPVGMVGIVGAVSSLGFSYLISFIALISINLAVINLIPFPALDGGRLLFVAIEAVKGSPIKPKVAQTLNAIGFFLLIALMAAVTYRDILNLIK